MRKFSVEEFKTFEGLLSLSQTDLKKTMALYLKKNYKEVFVTQHSVCAKGDIPIALVAHLDTVWENNPPKEIFYDSNKNVCFGSNGLGADDRAGVYAIIKIIKDGYRPHIILTTDEEVGGIGASKLACEKCPFEDLRYMIELDRKNANDCVFYDCDNPEFTSYIEDFGFVTNFGTYSDICELAFKWKIAAVNLSIGYLDEHTFAERLYVGSFFDTIKKVEKMLSEKNIPAFEFIESASSFSNAYLKEYFMNTSIKACKFCGLKYSEDSLIKFKNEDNGKIEHCCYACAATKDIYYCPCCLDYFASENTLGDLCKQCKEKYGEQLTDYAY